MADAVGVLCKLALSLPDVEEKIACAGTPIEQASFRTGGKSFLFAQRKGDLAIVRLKLDGSVTAAESAIGVGDTYLDERRAAFSIGNRRDELV